MFKKVFLFVFLFTYIVNVSIAQSVSIPDSILQKEIVVIDTTKIKTEEFLWFYNKYNSYIDSSLRLSLPESMNYFVDYKMKVMEAERQKLDTSAKYKEEFYSYITSTANSYLYDTEFDEKLLALEYERLKKDYKIQHIFIRSYKYNKPSDTLAAYTKALEVKKQITSGADFEKLAKIYSDDTFSKDQGGHLGYITSTVLPFEYENAIYTSNVGDIIGPVSTEYGYYITKIIDVRKTKGVARASIIVIYPETKDSIGWHKANLTIDTVYNKLVNGEDFNTLNNLYNTNIKLKSKNGDIGWLDNAVKYESKMKEEIFNIQKVGDFTKPLKFEYGYVICKLTNRDTLPAFSVYSKPVAKLYKGDESRKNIAKKEFLKKYRKEVNLKEYSANIQEFINIVDNSILIDKWEIPKIKNDKTLFQFNDSIYTFSDFADYIFINQKDKNISDKEVLLRMRLFEYQNKLLEQNAIQTLPQKNKEFATVMQEYHDGMIIYELLNLSVFQKSINDSIGITQFYNENKNNYLRKKGVEVTYYIYKDDKVLKKLISLVKRQQTENITDQYIMNQINKKDMDNVLRDTAIYYQGENASIDSLEWKKGDYHILKDRKLLVITNLIPVAPYPLELCKNQVISDYQAELEEKWIKELRAKYSFTINTDTFNQLQLLYKK